MVQDPDSERRRAPRRRRRLKMRYWNQDLDGLGYTVDMSQTGLLIETHKKVPVGTRLHLEIFLPEGSFFCECVISRILQSTSAVAPVLKSGMGVRFVNFGEVLRAMADFQSDAELKNLVIDLRDPEKFKKTFEQDIKRGGLFIATDWPPKVQSEVTIHLKLPTPHEDFLVHGNVVQVLESPPGAGIQLLNTEQVKEQLQTIMQAILRNTPTT